MSNVQNPSDIPLYWWVYIGILILAYYNPYKTGLFFIPSQISDNPPPRNKGLLTIGFPLEGLTY